MQLSKLATSVIALALLPLTANADSTRPVHFQNTSQMAVWVTLYSGSGRSGNIARGCVESGKKLTLEVPVATTGFYVLREFKNSKTSCAGGNAKVEEPGTRSTIFSQYIY